MARIQTVAYSRKRMIRSRSLIRSRNQTLNHSLIRSPILNLNLTLSHSPILNQPHNPNLKAAVEKAKTITTEQATALDAHLFYNPLHELTIDGKTYRYHNRVTSKDNDLINFSNLPMGYSTREVTYSVTPAPAAMGTTDLDPSKKDTAKGVLTVYQRPYSVVFAELLPLYGMDTSAHPFSFSDECKGSITNTGCYRSSLVSVLGYQTPYETLKGFAEGNQKFTYNGEAFTATEVPERGLFNYQVALALDKDGFFDVKGSGSITGLNSFGTITLGEGVFRMKERITPTDKEWDGSYTGVMNGNATASKGGRIGAYALGFFGPNAEEIAGQGSFGTDLFGFSGTR